jgi:hypothetical protein
MMTDVKINGKNIVPNEEHIINLIMKERLKDLSLQMSDTSFTVSSTDEECSFT